MFPTFMFGGLHAKHMGGVEQFAKKKSGKLLGWLGELLSNIYSTNCCLHVLVASFVGYNQHIVKVLMQLYQKYKLENPGN